MGFALLRDNGTVAFLRPTKGSTIGEYYEGLITDYVRTDYGQAVVHDLEGGTDVWFPPAALLTYTSPQNLHFLPYKKQYNALRGSATRPPQRVGR